MPRSPSRREALRLLAGGAAFAAACARPPPRPAMAWPDRRDTGEARFATAFVDDGWAEGVLAVTRMGRPLRIEGHPDHPASLGATSARAQASVLDLYDPDRLRLVRGPQGPSSWKSAAAVLARPGRVRVLLPATTSKTLATQLAPLHAHYLWPDAEARAGTYAAFGAPALARVDLAAARTVATFDADPLGEAPGRLRHARDFAAGRPTNRLFAVESAWSITGANADARLAARPADVAACFARVCAARLPDGPLRAALSRLAPGAEAAAFADLVVRAAPDLVLVGPRQPAWMHAAAAAAGLAPWVEDPRPWGEPLDDLLAALDAGEVDTLVVLDADPVGTLPRDLDLARRLRRARTIVVLADRPNATTAVADWVIPAAHALEREGDARAFDGTVTFLQPVVAPIWGGRAPEEVLAALTGDARTPRQLVDAAFPGRDARAGLAAAPLAPVGVAPHADAVAALIPAPTPAPPVEVQFRPCPRVGDGRYANNAWLQELPDSMTQLAWGNAALVGPATAKGARIEDGCVVAVRTPTGDLELPARVVPGQAEGVVTVDLGYGRTGGGRVETGVGVDANAVRRAVSPWLDVATLAAGRACVALPLGQATWTRERETTGIGERVQLWQGPPRDAAHQWGMAIDLDACIGCGACVVACQAENNVPVVGAEDFRLGRRMHWLRIDRYLEEGRPTFQPMACQHCETAPCEYVCPVGATTHSPDGLNEQSYQRCVGTRFCSNNCPYKVRRFNWFDYAEARPAELSLQLNPEVTVRARGVIEKCTYCVQRVRAFDEAERMGLAPAPPQTACQQACPTRAIVFGDLRGDTEVARLHADPRATEELGELGTRPRTRYLTRRRPVAT